MSLISPTPTTSPPSTKPKLLTIPPELLLQILTYLPSSSSLHALSQASRTINAFLHTYAATLTNSLILTHHSHASSILRAQHTPNSSGFLVPTHPLVLAEERRIQRDKILASGCHCLPCRLMLHTGTSSTSNLSLDSRSSSEREGLISTCLPIPASTMGVSECRAKAVLESTIKLTKPGPQFLVFLEKYGWEIQARWAVFMKHQHKLVEEEEEHEDGSESGDDEGAKPEMASHGEDEKVVFEFMIGNYCVKKFLEDTEKEFSSHKSLASAPPSPVVMVKEKFKVKLRKKFARKKTDKKEKAMEQAPPTQRRMFGEIEKAPTTTAIEKDTWVKGLLWYHGLSSGVEPEMIEEDPVTGSHETTKPKSKGKNKNCMSGMKAGMKKAGSSMGNWFRRLRCGGDFQSLDD